jgi:hypothetical protein
MLVQCAEMLRTPNNENKQKQYAGALCRQVEGRSTGLIFNGTRGSKQTARRSKQASRLNPDDDEKGHPSSSLTGRGELVRYACDQKCKANARTEKR